MFILSYIINLHVILLLRGRLLMTFATNGTFENVHGQEKPHSSSF
jgi:hypothetical protein